jgi:hypothetical protein
MISAENIKTVLLEGNEGNLNHPNTAKKCVLCQWNTIEELRARRVKLKWLPY